MPQPSDSFKQFDYALRPSKQVERKMMIEILLRLSRADYLISEYTYLGLGSVYYVDFVMFHKYLFIDRMICLEWSPVPKRMKFNKPFKFINLKLASLADYIPSIAQNKRYLAWFDYDRALDPAMLQDIDGCLVRLAPKSVFIVTIDARPKLPKDMFPDDDIDGMTTAKREQFTAKAYRQWFGEYTAESITRLTVADSDVASLFYAVSMERIRQTLEGRGLKFIQLFNYLYKDGAPMLTIGGMVGTDDDEAKLQRAGIFGHRFVQRDSQYLKISVPPLTLREKQWLDSRMDRNLTADGLTFELEDALLDNYRKFYKEYPTYMETML
jgi:hypothetical protein